MAKTWEKITWQEYGALRKRERARLYHAAEKGNKQAQAVFKDLARQIKTETNKRLRGLERHKYDYGATYNNLVNYLTVQHYSMRVLSFTALKRDYSDVFYMTEQALKFLHSNFSIWKNVEMNEMWKYENIRAKQIEGSNLITGQERKGFKNYRQAKEFLRFLGNEEVSAALDQVGASDEMVEAMYDAYEVQGNKMFKVLEKSFNEFNSGKITFDEAMERTGIKIEDYYSRRATT